MTDLSLNIIIFIGAIVTLFVISIAANKLRRRFSDVPYLLIAGIIAGITILIYAYTSLVRLEGENYELLEKVLLICKTTALLFIYRYFEALLTSHPPFWRYGFVILLCSFSMIIFTLSIFDVFKDETFYWIGSIVENSFGLWVGAFGIYVTNKAIKVFYHKGLKLDLIAFIIVFLAFIPFLIISITIFTGLQTADSILNVALFIISNGLLCLAIIFLLANTMKHGDYIYSLPLPIYAIFIYNQGGVLTYYRRFKIEGRDDFFSKNETLVSGAFMAFGAFFKEILGAHTKLSYINAGDYEFFLTPLENDVGTLAIATSGVNYFFERSLRRLISQIPKELFEKINVVNSLDEFNSMLDPLIKKTFPYLKIDENSN